MTPGERIKILRSKNDISQKQLSEDLGYKTYTTISKWESDASLPPGKELKKLASYFKVSTDYILGLDEERDLNNQDHSNELPYIESLNPFVDEKEILPHKIKVPNYILKEPISHYYVLNVHTDSMNRIIPAGNKIVILDFRQSKDSHLKTGDVIVVKLNNEYGLKYFRKTDTTISLEPYSYLEGFKTLTYDLEEFEAIEVLGKVVYTFRTFS